MPRGFQKLYIYASEKKKLSLCRRRFVTRGFNSKRIGEKLDVDILTALSLNQRDH